MNDAIVATQPSAVQLAPMVPHGKMKVLADVIAPGLTPDQLDVFATVCNRVRLDPFAKQIHGVVRMTWNPQTRSKEPRLVIQTGIDGFRVIAERTGEYEGEGDYQWCGEDGAWRDIWLDDENPPSAARATVWRKGRRPTVMIARWSAYVQTTQDGKPNSMWSQRGPEQLAKCAVALAFRAAFPHDLSGLYANDEMDQADRPAPPKASVVAQVLPGDTRLRGTFGALKDRVLEECTCEELGHYIAALEKLPEARRLKAAKHIDAVGKIFEAIATREMDRKKAEQPPAAADKDPIAEGLQRSIDQRREREPGDDDESYLSGGAP